MLVVASIYLIYRLTDCVSNCDGNQWACPYMQTDSSSCLWWQ